MPNPNRTYGYRRPTNKRTETIKYVRNSAKTTSSLQDLVNKVKNVVRDVANQITGGGGNTASFTIPKNTPSVRPEVRDGFKQTQGNFNSLLHDDSSKKYGTSFKYNGFDLKSLQEARDIKPSPLDAQRQITDKMAEMAIATAPLTGTSKDKDIAKAAAGQYSEGNITDETQEYLGIISDMWSGKYSYGVTQKEWNEWRKAAFKNTGDYVKNDKGEYELDENGNKIPEFVLRPDAPPPPMGTDEATYKRWEKKNTYLTQVFDEDKQEWVETRLLNENAEEVPKTTEDFKKYWNWYLAFDNQLQDNEKKAIEQSYHMAGIDPNASDSMFDIVRDVISGTDKDPIKGTLDYFKNYVWNPLKKGDWGTLGLNTLVNLGETMDAFASGMRASVASKDVLKFSNSDVLEGQYEFVYSGGEDKQKELMDLGAERLIYLNTHRPRNYKVQAAKIEDKLKAAGKWDDFVQLENEWRAHDNEGSFVQNIKDVYTDPSKNFNADSGNFVKDMVIETILDPSLLIGGVTKLAASGGARTVTHSALRAAALARGSEDILNYVESGNKVVRQYLKGAGEGLLMQNKSTIRRNAKNLAETMAKQNVMSETEVDHFVDLITEAIGDVKGNKQYKFIQSMHRADKFVDKMDTVLLKTSFIVPYAPFGTLNKTRKLLRNNKRFAEWQGAGRGLREQQAMSELLDGLKNDYGMFRVNSLDELLKRMDENVMLREDPKVKTGVIKNVTEHMKAYMGNIHELSVQLKDGGFSPDEFDEALNLRIRQLSEGKYNSIDEFSDGINAAFNEHAYKYSSELDNIKTVVDKQIKDIDDLKAAAVDEFSVKFYKDLSSAESIEDIQDLIVRVRRFNNSLDTPEVFQGDILKRVNELGLGEFKTTDDLIRKFEFKNAKTVKEPSAVISAVLDNMDEPSKYLNQLHPQLSDAVNKFADTLKSYVGSNYFSNDLISLLFEEGKLRDLSDINPRAFHEILVSEIQEKQLRLASVNAGASYFVLDVDKQLLDSYIEMDRLLVDTQLGISVRDSRELLEVHCDLFDVFNKFVGDSRFVNYINYVRQENGIVDQLYKVYSLFLDFEKELNYIASEGGGLPSDIDHTLSILDGMFNSARSLNVQADVLTSYNNFCVSLEQIPGLSQDQYWTILDSVFGFTRNNPEDFYIKNTRNLDAFIDKINLNMDTLFGRSKVKLDGFREEARDFSSDLWKDYSDEISDPTIQKRVDTILSGGHLDPVQDVRTQMLQVILRDKDAIDYYNSLAKSQDVFFMDIETQGRNTALHEITDLAYMQWQPDVLSSNSSLDDILSFIENGISSRYTTKHLAEDIDKNISSETLKYLFSDQPNAGRNELLEQYKNVYGAADEAGVVTEDSILKNFMADMDRSFDARNSNSPVLVTHSTQGFDINFIRDRVQYYKDRNINIYPSHIAHMQDIIDASESTVERLKCLTGDIILTSSQVSAVKDAFITFAKDLPDSVTDLKLLNLDSYHSIVNLPSLFDDIDIRRLLDYGYSNHILDPALERSFDDLFKLFDSKEYKNAVDEFLGFNHDVFLDTKRFNGNLLLDPFPHSNLFKESFDMGDSVIPEVGYRKVGMDTSKYFDFSSETEIPYDITIKCTDFMKDVENIINNKLKQNTLLENYYDEFVNIVNMTKAYASDLQVGDPFYYFKYLKEPESVNEAYATAQLIWDKTLKYVKDDTIKKYTKMYKGVNALPQTVRDYVLDFAMSGNEFDLILSDGCRNLLNGKYDESIYKYAISDLYYSKLTTPFEDINDFNVMQSEINEHLKSGSAYTAIAEQYYDSAINYALQDSQKLLSDIAESVKYIELSDKDQFANLLNSLSSYHNKRRNTMTAQIMDYVSQSEDNLLSHLLFHNHQLHIPVRGSKLHVSQVDQLRELLNNMDAPIVFKEQNGYIHIGLDKDIKYRILNDSRYVDEEATVKIDGRDVVYTCPKYEKIDFDPAELEGYLDSSLYMKIGPDGNMGYDVVALQRVRSIFNNMKSVYDQIDFLSEGKGVGSIGTLHTLNRQHQLYKSLPKDFVDNILTEDISCDARFWHQASFDMTCLGDSAYVWKVTDYNDADPLLSMFKTLENIAGSATAEKMYLGYFDDANSSFKLNNLLNDVSDKEKLEILQNVDDMVIVNFSAMDKYGGFESSTGVEVSALQLNDLTDLKRAEASGAMLVPYDVFLDMQEVFNKSTMTSTFLKGWSKILWLYKVGQLGNLGTWMRNWLDATMKMTSEVGSVGDSARFQLKAAHMLMNYKKISRMIKKNSGLNYTTATDIEREFSRLPERYRQYMTYDEYKFIDDWLQISIAGGQSRTLKSVQDYTDNAVNLNIALKQGSTRGVMTPGRVEDLKQVYDLVGSNIERFEDLGEEEITYLIGKSDRKLWDKMDRDRFLQILREGYETATDEELYDYNEIANKLIEQRFKKIRREHTISNVMNNVLSGTFKPMSGVEEVVRFAQYLALDERGYTKSQIFNSIVSSQFNYDNKTMRAKMLEMFIPYYGFMDSNLSYWLHALDENPRMLRYIEHIWGNLSWDAAFQYGEDPKSNGSVNYMMLHGGIPIGSTGMYLKTEPSFLQPLNMMFGNPSEYLNILAPPFQLGINALLNYGAKEYSSFFHDISTYSFDDKSGLDVFLDNLPIAGSLKTRYVDHFTEKRNWERLVGASDLQKAIVKFNPSMLNVVKRYMVGDADELDLMQGDVEAQLKAAAGTNYIESYLMEHNPALFGALKRQDTSDEDSWDIFLKDLEKDGKWWDANLMQVVPIELKNYDGLNNPNLSFDERARLTFIYHGKLWDANQNRFVEPGQFRPGGLNQDFDLSESGEWDKLCKLKKKYLDQKWDYNTRSWIPSSEWEPVMLNDPNLSWEDNQRYHRELFGERYDYNQGKYVQKEQFTKGGLNSKRGSLSWEELCALQYALHGKEWIPGEGFVKTTEPIVNFLLPDLDLDKTIKLDRTDPKEKAFISFSLVDVAYADTEDPTLEDEPYEMQGRWILNGNRKHDAAIFAEIIAEYSNKAPGYTGYKTYGPWHNYSSVPRLPKSIQYSKRYSKNKGRKFSYSYTSGGEYAALRMALYGSKIYEDYYKNEFNYNYSYRSPSAGPKKYYGSLYHQGTYNLQGMKNRSEGKWRYYRR